MGRLTLALFILITCVLSRSVAEILTPPYFNLAYGKQITASATCGDEGPELYCKLVGANADHDEHVIQGQVCDYCESANEAKRHPPEYAVDGMETWWQSPPLSRSMKYNEVNLTIDLGQEFHVAYVFLKMGNSPRPGLWALEKSTDYGKTFKPWQYFSDSPQDCVRYFGKESLQPITRDDSVICSTEYSKIVPLEGGEIPISLLKYRPSANKYFNSSELQEWTRATNVRLQLLRTNNLLGHLMSVARQDPTVTRRYFYSIKDISIGGRCLCNGHADTCDPVDPEGESNILVCRCQHNTCGPQCAQCCRGFEQKKWRISQNWNRFACEPCNCHNHTNECRYDPEVDEKHLSLDIHGRYEGGGVCEKCQHNTEGINCNKCKPKYYRPHGRKWDDINACQSCNCDNHFSTGNCAEGSGQCECREEFNPPFCDSCAYGYYDYPNCKRCPCNLNGTEGGYCTPTSGLCPCKYNYIGITCEKCADGYYSLQCKNCECNTIGSVSAVCDKDSGNCTCKSKYSGRTCNQCEAGFFNYPSCSHCNCDTSGTEPSICDDVTGQCICKEGFGGARCDQCISGYYMEVKGRERVCVPCNCSATGSTSTSCSINGKCNCLSNFGGKQCDQCSPGYYKYSECLPCNCDPSGSIGASCDDNGQCLCMKNFDGTQCEQCKEHFYNYPACEECNCDPRGVVASFAGCGSVPAGELCQCKDRVQGRICNDCKPLFWNLQEYNPQGCEECDCNLAGTLGGLGSCNTRSGQCTCKMHVGETKCDECQDNFYQLEKTNIFGCTECDCDVGGAVDHNCEKKTGQCRCHSRVKGRRCDKPIEAHYFPTLHQFQYEIEEGSTPSGPVRYRNDENDFVGYSWKGYVVFSLLQNEVISVVHISKSSLYRLVLRYVNRLRDPVIATIVTIPDNAADTEQMFSVLLKPTSSPQFVTVSGEKSNAPAHFVMNEGNWTVTIKTTKEVLIDYFVLVPEPYYEARVLTKQVDKPCVVGDHKLCRLFAYPRLNGRAAADVSNLVTPAVAYIGNSEQLKELKAGPKDIPMITNDHNELHYKIKIDEPGPYVILVEYVTPIEEITPTDMVTTTNNTIDISTKGTMTVRFQSGEGGDDVYALLNLNNCPYTTPCRQVVVNDVSNIQIVNVQDADNDIVLEGELDTLAGITSIVVIPEAEWHLDYITPRPYCLRKDGQCKPAVFSKAVDSKKVDIESGEGGDRETRPPILDNSTMVVYLGAGVGELKLESKVPLPDQYMFVIHYYQPAHPESSVDVILTSDNQQYEAVLSIEHCPSNSGCRALLHQADQTNHFPITENFTLTFKGESSNGVWLDYVLVIATPDYANSVLKETNVLDYTSEFISKCANNSYYINTNDTGFCRDSVFSITTEYNSGTLQCYCEYEGSTDLQCEEFGGQCKCKPNVTGRTCSACRTGFYGYPDCRPCHCPTTALCDDYGSCICPNNVEGENCDRCKPQTFNYDEYRGCDECNCKLLGVIDGQLQCDLDSGNCACKQNVMGRTCDHCVPGHYAFPYCMPCECRLAGTTDQVCDQNTAQCYCKKHVSGQACDTCKDEYFNLQSDNAVGCTKCYCFGKTTRCASASDYGYVWVQIVGMEDWYLANIEVNRTLSVYLHTSPPSMLNDSVIGADLLTDEGNKKIVYFGAPSHYLGKRLTSYGGHLKYSIFYTAGSFGNAIAAPDVVIRGPNGYIVHNSVEQPPAVQHWMHSVRFIEDEFTNIDGSAVTRDQFMNTLVNITAIYIRATYWEVAVTTRLQFVSLDIAVEDLDYGPDTQLASSVEQCFCPSAYRGLSCEQCAEGHYRISTGPHAGFCVPCQCNGHSTTCDVNTGVCLNCEDNTVGDHCEQCIPGYHGDASGGTPYDCLICACPIPITSNNFAIGCNVSSDGSSIFCDCLPGYKGQRCEYCGAGYYGEPEITGNYCKPCNCSGNINPEDPSSCDTRTGNCLKCVNNTAGAACNLCAPGFYGDAIFSKNCTACACDEFGMEKCNPATGICECRPGVIGDKCDRCLTDHWGLSSGQGCTPCACAIASNSTQCDDDNGQCRCAKGVTGKHCDMCAAGYWNYTSDGCDHCNCNTGYSVGFMCNTQTGQCECLPGVIGEKCDRCPDRWVLIPHEGCQECDSCTDALIFTVTDLSDWLTKETQDFKNKADSFFTTQRLNYISNQAQLQKPKVAALKSVDLNDVTAAVEALETNAKNSLRSAEFAATDSEDQIGRAAKLAAAASKILTDVRDGSAKAHDAVKHVVDLATGLELSQQPKVDSALVEARQIKSDIAAKDLEPKRQISHTVYANATQQFARMDVFVQPVLEQNKVFEVIENSTRQLMKKSNEMLKYTDLAQSTADAADKLTASNRASTFGDKVQVVSKQNAGAMEDIVDAAYLITNASALFAFSKDNVNKSTKALDDLETVRAEMGNRILSIDETLPDLKNVTDVARHHTNALKNRADSLKKLAERESNNSRTQDAFAAASAYSSIRQEIDDAKKAAESAEEALRNATEINNKVKERVGPGLNRSIILKKEAVEYFRDVKEYLTPGISQAELGLDTARNTHSAADDAVSAIEIALPSPKPFLLDEQMDRADKVNASVRHTLDIMASLGGDVEASKKSAESLPKIADDARKEISNIRKYIENIKNIRPNITNTFKSVDNRQKDLERIKRAADEKLQKLRELIEQARTVVNRIAVGVAFDKTSTLQPRLPDTIDEMSTSTRVSAYFRTEQRNGLLLYLGNPKGTMLRRTKSDDFMLLEIQNGYPYLVMDIGDGAESGREPARIGSDKFVADNRWYQVIVDRVGRNVKLSIRESLENGSDIVHYKEAVLPGQQTIFNLDKKKSKLYVGGAPSGAKLQEINYPAFEGQIEELMIGDTPVGLWNFESAQNLKGGRQRDKLVTSQSGPTEYRFNGRGHVTMPAKQYVQTHKNNILLFFRTYAPEGLIYLLGERNSFFSVQMQDGRVYLQICLGDPNELLIIGTRETYNDGKWHKLDAARYHKGGVLKIDNEPPIKQETSGPDMNLNNIDYMNFGGNNNGIVAVTTKGFDGCLRQIVIDKVNIDLSENRESIGVTNGCQFASLVSLNGDNSFLRYENVTSEAFQITMKFKTSAPDGLLFVYFNREQIIGSDIVSLSLVKGKLVFMSQREQLDTDLSTYNDSHWHVVTAVHTKTALRMVVDDFETFSTDFAPAPLHILDGVLFVGGIQPGYVISGTVGTRASFTGCIADATLNGRVLNLLEPYYNQSSTFGRCGSTTTTGGAYPGQTEWPVHQVPDRLPTYLEPFSNNELGRDTKPTSSPPFLQSTPPITTQLPLPTTPAIIRGPPPILEKGCALAYDPMYVIGDPREGYRFGSSNNSRIEYKRLPGRQHGGFDLSLSFRTYDHDGGLMFYAAADPGHIQFLALYMKGGHIHFSFNCGTEIVHKESRGTYNDTEWHTVVISRDPENKYKLSADNQLVDESYGMCATPDALRPPFYYGGLEHITDVVQYNLQGFYQPFMGCLRGLEMNGRPFTEYHVRVNALQCKDNIEDGVFFGPPGGYLRLKENFKVGYEISIVMEIKPRHNVGLLLSVHGKKDYLVLELDGSNVVVHVQNGKSNFSAVFNLGNNYTLCDGQWHKIHTLKSRHVVSVGVDGHFSSPVVGDPGHQATKTKSALFIGGHVNLGGKLRGVTSNRGYSGCIKNININDVKIPIPLNAGYGNVHIGSCPAD